MSGTFTSIILATSASPCASISQKVGVRSAQRRARPLRIDLVKLNRVGDGLGGQKLVVGKRFQRRDRDMITVDLEERTQPAAIIGAAEPIGSQSLETGGNEGPDAVRNDL